MTEKTGPKSIVHGDPVNKRISIIITQDQYAFLKDKVECTGLTLSAYLRYLIDGMRGESIDYDPEIWLGIT